ncbi:MAG: nucleoside kinase, partial [Prevotellaceae bacterium]|nr:nucleoside kinase [Prevotellaceae bacterium]
MNPITILCENTGLRKGYTPGTSLMQVAREQNILLNGAPPLAALANHLLKELWYELFAPQTLLFLGYEHPDGRRCYQRSLTFLMQKAAKELFPELLLTVNHSVGNGFYCELRGLTEVTPAIADAIAHRMAQLVEADLPFEKTKIPTTEAIAIFQQQGYVEKARLQQTRGRLYTSVYYLDGYADHFYGPLAPSTGYLRRFAIAPHQGGMALMFPNISNPNEVDKLNEQKKIFDIFHEHKTWVEILQAGTVGQINELVQQGESPDLIKISEALHEKKYAQIADQISLRRHEIKLILIAGPSSSGKTTTSKRLAIQLKVAGFTPKVLEMDNYFVNRDRTPIGDDGKPDFESIHAVDLALFNEHLEQLLRGERVELPKFSFSKGERFYDGTFAQLNEKDILVVEGIHALNPALTAAVAQSQKFCIYASALTSVSLDSNNRISTTDNRLVRRMVRDAATRGHNACATLHLWSSVRRGEER